jgi:uncharacterized protein YjbI with pentapeptide repeats
MREPIVHLSSGWVGETDQIRHSELSYTNISGVDTLSSARLSRLRKAGLLSFMLDYVNLRGADLSFADLIYANLRHANLENANLFNANLRGADLESAELHEATLSEAGISDTILICTVLTAADLTNANVSCANLTNVDLSETKGLTQPQINQAIGDENTRLQRGYQRPETWRGVRKT